MEGRELVAFSAALIAALLSIAKLVADKESRISDFRKDWINSFRAALSEIDVPPRLNSTAVWSPILNDKEIGREEALTEEQIIGFLREAEKGIHGELAAVATHRQKVFWPSTSFGFQRTQ